jgi:hypothetical protein
MMKPSPVIVLAAAIALIVQGCSSMQWSKPGADAAAVSRDIDQCRAQALRGTPAVSPVGSPEARTDGRRPGALAPTAGSSERFIDEHEVVSACMLRRGYELRPAG